MSEDKILRKIAMDLELCAIGEALTSGKQKQRYKNHRKQCHAYIKQLNERDGLNDMSDDELLKALGL